MGTPRLVVFSGLPGTGKSTLARVAGGVLQCPVFGKDDVHATLLRSGLSYERAGWMAHHLITMLAQNQLRAGQSAILDSVTAHQKMRDDWAHVAEREGAVFRGVECVCSDPDLHRARLTGRGETIPGWRAIQWEDVAEVASRYEPWTGEHLVLDGAQPLELARKALQAYLADDSVEPLARVLPSH